jgi:hypothetical protein
VAGPLALMLAMGPPYAPGNSLSSASWICTGPGLGLGLGRAGAGEGDELQHKHNSQLVRVMDYGDKGDTAQLKNVHTGFAPTGDAWL